MNAFRIFIAVTGLALGSLTANAAPPAAARPVAPTIPAGEYHLDHSHATLLFRVNHLGFSMYTARFRRFDATLQFDPTKIARSKLSVQVEADSLETDYPDPATLDFNAELRGEGWLETAKYPQFIYQSQRVTMTGPGKFRIDGSLTMHGVTRPVSLQGRYNGGYAGHPMDPHARIGFSARGHLKRSEFGISYGIPAPGTTMGVSDDVEVIIEAEFSGPPLPPAPAMP